MEVCNKRDYVTTAPDYITSTPRPETTNTPEPMTTTPEPELQCNWISYSQEKQLCLYLETCTLDTTNEDFVSAHASCGAPPISKQNSILTFSHTYLNYMIF